MTSSDNKKEQGFITDASLGDEGKDLYNRENYAKELANKINNTYSSEALAVGINGEWGISKTSFFDLLKRYINKQSFILVDFNPWGSINEEDVILNFFNTLKLEVKKYSSRLSSLIFDYSNSLAAVSNNNVIKSSIDVIRKIGTESLDSKFSEINDLLMGLHKRIIIFIDDLDRLQKDEIIQVIKLIRNTANFNNTIFVVSYDRNYICGAFEELGKANSLYYLEKIFQLEFYLPFIDSMMLRKNLVNLLEASLDEKYSTEIKKLYSPNTSSLYYPFLDGYLKTLRDVNRFINLFSFQFNQIQNEVSFSDYFNITLLKMKYPELVKVLYEMREEFFDRSKKDDMDRMHLKISEKETLLKQYLDKNRDDFHLDDNDIQKFDNSIRVIFGEPVTASSSDDNWSEFASTFYIDREINSIVFTNTFYRYFANQIFSIDISDVDWNECFTLSYDEFIAKIKEWIRQGARKEIYLRFKMLKDFKNQRNFENVIRAIFELANYTINSDDDETEAWFDYENLVNFFNRDDVIAKDYYGGNKDQYLKFLTQVLRTDKNPDRYIVGFISLICNDPNYHKSFPIPKLELIEINVEYLNKYISRIDLLDKTVWGLFYSCKYVELKPDRTVLHPIAENAKAEMKKFIRGKGIEHFIQSVAIAQHEEDRFYISDGVWAVFGPPDAVLDFVNEYESTPMIKEFKEFYEQCKATGIQSYINFDFKEIKIDR